MRHLPFPKFRRYTSKKFFLKKIHWSIDKLEFL